jgi:hypothetical protein
MSYFSEPVVQQLLVSVTLRFFFIGGIFCLLVGLGLIISSEKTLRFFGHMNRWVSFRKGTKPLFIPRDFSTLLRQYRRWFAVVFIVGACFSLFTLTTGVDMSAFASILAAKSTFPRAFIVWIVDSVWLFLVIGNLLAVIIGIMLGFFPHAVFALETGSGRWFSFREASKSADMMHLSLDNWVAASPRATGWIIVAIALVELVNVSALLFR